MSTEDTIKINPDQEYDSDMKDVNMEDEDRDPDDRYEGEAYTAPVYSSHEASRLLTHNYGIDKIDYNMVRYWARKFPEFLPDATNVESGNLKLSVRDIEVIKQILDMKTNYKYSVDRIRRELSSMSNAGLEKPSIMTNEMFANLLKSEGFQDFMHYYTREVLKNMVSTQNEKYESLTQKVDLILQALPSPAEVAEQAEKTAQLEDLQSELEEKQLSITKLEESKKEFEEEIQRLKDELEHEKSKSLWEKLFKH